MWRRILVIGLVAGVACGLLSALAHHYTTTPLLVQAEVYERAAQAGRIGVHDSSVHEDARGEAGDVPDNVPSDIRIDARNDATGDASDSSASAEVNPAIAIADIATVRALLLSDPVLRTVQTALSTVLISLGFAWLLCGCLVVHASRGARINGRRGLLWGLGGFAVFALAPAIGLPPEVPGVAVADLGARQAWWLLTVVCTASGLVALVFGTELTWRVAGVTTLFIPHLIGAPLSPHAPHLVPAEIAVRFAVYSLVIGALFWSLLGWLSGTLSGRWVTGGGDDGDNDTGTGTSRRAR